MQGCIDRKWRAWLGPLLAAIGIGHAGAEAPSSIFLRLEDAIQSALAFNRQMALDHLDVRAGELSVDRARMSFQTRLLPDSRVTMGSDDPNWQVGAAAVRQTSWGAELTMGVRQGGVGEIREAGLRAELRQPLLRDFGRAVHTEPLRKADERLLAARRAFEDRRAALVLAVIELYYRSQLLEGNLVADEALAKRTEALARLTKAQERLGRTTRVDSLRVELQRGEALARIASNRERLAATQRDLADLLGLPPEATLDLDPPSGLAAEWPSLEEALLIAWSHRLDYAQAMNDLEASRRGARLAAREIWPDIKLLGGYERFGRSHDWSAAWNLSEDRFYIGLTTDSDLLRREARWAVDEADLNAAGAFERLRLLRRAIGLEIQQRLAAGRGAETEAEIAERNRELAVGRARLARRLFELGRGDNFTVTDAEQALSDAEQRLRNARAECALNVYRLARALGTLLESPPEFRPSFAGDH